MDDLPVAEVVAGISAGVAAPLAAVLQAQEYRRPVLGAVTLGISVAWALDLAPGRLVLACGLALGLSLVESIELRALGAFAAVAAFATTMPRAVDASDRLVAAVAVAICVAVLVWLFPHLVRHALVVLFAATVGGFLALPDTERIGLATGLVAVLALVSLFFPPPWATAPGMAVAAAFVVWAGTTDARGRPASFVSVAAPLTLVLVLAAVHRWGRRPVLWVVFVVGGGLAVWSGRVAGLRDDRLQAVLLAAVGVVVAAAAVAATSRPARAATD